MAKSIKEGSGIPQYLSNVAQDRKNIKMGANSGYVIAPEKIIRCFRLNDIEKILLLEIVSYMGENDYAFPSHKRLAFKLGKKSTASIKNGLNALKEKGFIYWSKGGGDLGTNHYRLCDLYYNPYLIMSEFTHFFVEEILKIHRGDISYEDIYLTVLEIVEKPKNLRGDDDQYAICIDSLSKDIKLRDRIDMYWLFGDILKYNISMRSSISISIDVMNLIVDYFKKYHPTVNIDYEDHPIHEVLESPYLPVKEPFEVRAAGVSNEEVDILRDYNKEVWDKLDVLDEKEIYKVFIEEVIMSCPDGVLSGTGIYNQFMLMEDTESRIDLVKEVFPFPQPKYFIGGHLLRIKQHELNRQTSEIK